PVLRRIRSASRRRPFGRLTAIFALALIPESSHACPRNTAPRAARERAPPAPRASPVTRGGARVSAKQLLRREEAEPLPLERLDERRRPEPLAELGLEPLEPLHDGVHAERRGEREQAAAERREARP